MMYTCKVCLDRFWLVCVFRRPEVFFHSKFDASRRGKKGLTSSRDKKEGAYRNGEGGEEPG